MRARKLKSTEQKPTPQRTSTIESKILPIIISARTGLAGKDDAIMKNLPKSYSGKTIEAALDYLLQQKSLEDDEIPLAKSIEKEMKSDDFVIVVNGKNAKLSDKVTDYLMEKEHHLPNNEVKAYNALEIEISAVQQGGSYSLN